MDPIVVQLANGNTFFFGIGMTVVAFAVRLLVHQRLWVILLTVVWLLGISLVVLSAAPISYWLYGLWFALCIATRAAFNLHVSIRSKISITIVFAVFSLVVCLVELPFHLAKTIPVSKKQTIYIIGDSISAGIQEKERTWPAVLEDLSQLKVVNLAVPGATLESAMYQANKITATNSLILVEIGGNDLLGHTDSHTFYIQLDKLLANLEIKNSRVVMFELPLLPFWNTYGRDQRILAEKYGVTLIPKNYLVEAFAGKGNTIDGLHLTQKGHDELAEMVHKLLVTNGPQ
ncbi:MAG TPA: GDSL-type esterase/lipase family protein [Pseudomonadales bacterium]|nr:GDSL-type esterase/lipase family protein [Pseudomonadales bacterium]